MENLDPEAKPDKTHCRLLIVLETNVLNMGKILFAALAVFFSKNHRFKQAQNLSNLLLISMQYLD